MFLAYKYVALVLMLGIANQVGPTLGLRENLPIGLADLRKELVASPEMEVFLGRVDARAYAFSFSESGKICYIYKLKAFGDLSLEAKNRMLGPRRSTAPPR